jgi:hypothetical protein
MNPKMALTRATQNNPPCRACFRPCNEKGDYYCEDCISTGAATWHRDMLAKWQAELEAKEQDA